MASRRNMLLALMGTMFLKISAYPQMTPANPPAPGKGPTTPATSTTTAPPSAPMGKTGPPTGPAAAAAPAAPAAPVAPAAPAAPAAPGAPAPMAKAPTTPMAANAPPAAAAQTPPPPVKAASPPPAAVAQAPPEMANAAPPNPMGLPPLPQGVFELQARARLVSPKGEGVTAFFEFFNTQSGDQQVGVRFSVAGLDKIQPPAPAKYHIHTNPIPPNGDCSAALGHLTPNNIPDSFQCNPSTPNLCQEGDLSGKHGLLPPVPVYRARYVDNFLRFSPEAASILGRSVVIHGPNGSRVSCGNITSILDGTADFNGNPTGQPSTRTFMYPKSAPKRF